MRIAYLDETGISRDERFTVVSAVVIPGDKWREVRRGLSDLADHCIPAERREGFVFHAKELYHGGKLFPRDKYLPQHGREILKSLVHIPADNGLPVTLGWIDKRNYADRPDLPTKESDRAKTYHALAFCECIVTVEKLMRDFFPDECVQLVVENNSEHRTLLKEVYRFFQTEEAAAELSTPDTENWLPLRHIIDTPNFAEKTESSPLQLADATAFAIKRHIERKADAAEYYDPLIPVLTVRPKMELVAE